MLNTQNCLYWFSIDDDATTIETFVYVSMINEFHRKADTASFRAFLKQMKNCRTAWHSFEESIDGAEEMKTVLDSNYHEMCEDVNVWRLLIQIKFN